MLLRYGKGTSERTKVYMDTGKGTDVWVVPRGEQFSIKEEVPDG